MKTFEQFNESDIMWWGYLHTNGKIQVKRWFNDPRDLDDAYESPFCDRVFQPFPADSRENAIEHIQKLLSK